MQENENTQITSAAGGIDLAGVGKAMSAIPPEAWQQMVNTACTTFEKVLAPVTETTYGIGRLIKTKFDGLLDAQKFLAAKPIESAILKAKQSGRDLMYPRPQILIQVIEISANETDVGVRELWSNLLAQEMVSQCVHPEIGKVLSRICSEDAQLLVSITEEQPTLISKLFAQAVKAAVRSISNDAAVTLQQQSMTFNHAHLRNLGLIERNDGVWRLTVFGEGFIKAVTDPSLEKEH